MNTPLPVAWQPLAIPIADSLPDRVRPWMALNTSMTAELRRIAGTPLRVEVLHSGRAALHPDEHGFFDTPADAGCVREVCLHGAGEPLLAARTVHASARLEALPALANLGTRPLGELLFAGGAPAPWSRREFAELRPGTPSPLRALVERCLPTPAPACWCRRTLFRMAGEPLLVTEIFLPSVERLAGTSAEV